eukprot:scaffold3045_cov78-Skeletonema_dohrnii-CCMP3373.AAC.6
MYIEGSNEVVAVTTSAAMQQPASEAKLLSAGSKNLVAGSTQDFGNYTSFLVERAGQKGITTWGNNKLGSIHGCASQASSMVQKLERYYAAEKEAQGPSWSDSGPVTVSGGSERALFLFKYW